MNIKQLLIISLAFLLNTLASFNSEADNSKAANHEMEIAIIGNNNLNSLNASQIKKIYTGRIIEIGGIILTPINIETPNAIRREFLLKYLNQNEDQYSAYWIVRRFIGKGVPPKELDSDTDIVNFIRNTPGSLGYIDATRVPEDLTVLAKWVVNQTQ